MSEHGKGDKLIPGSDLIGYLCNLASSGKDCRRTKASFGSMFA